MARCAVYKCINGRIKRGLQRTEKVVYHKFPKKSKLATLWWQATKRRRSYPCKSDCICSVHFSKDSYVRDLQHELLGLPPRKRLREDAIPSLYLPVFPQGTANDKKIKVPVIAPKRKRGRPRATPNNYYDKSHNEELQMTIQSSFISTEDPSRYMIEEITGESLSEENPVQRLQNDFHCQNLLRNMFLDDVLMDVALIAEERIVKAHRAVLRQASGYFKQVLSLDVTVESEITLKDIIYEDLVKIIGFIYLGEVSIRSSNLCRFLKTAEKLEIFSLLPWSEDSEESEAGINKEEISVEEGEERHTSPHRIHTHMEDKHINEDYIMCNTCIGIEENGPDHQQSSDFCTQLDRRKEPIVTYESNIEAETPFEYNTKNRIPLLQFPEMYNKNYSEIIVTESAKGSIHLETVDCTFGSSDQETSFNSLHNNSHFNLPSTFNEQTIIHHEL